MESRSHDQAAPTGTAGAFAPLLLSACAFGAMAAPADASSKVELVEVASSETMVWNGVVSDRERIIVSGPRWSGSKGPPVGVVQGPVVRPYPDAAWNGWRPGADPAHAFVDVNAIHLDAQGHLWIVDTGAATFGGDPLPGGAKLVEVDLASDRVLRVYPLGPTIAQPGSYVDDIRFNGRHAYLTDSGKPGLIVLDVDTGSLRRVLEGDRSTVAAPDRDVILSGRVIRKKDGKPLRIQVDPLEVSPDGRWLYFAPLSGPWSRIETRYLDDPALTPQELAQHVEPWADLPPVGGTAMDSDGTLYFNDLAADAVRRRTPDGRIETIIHDPRLHWVDAPFLDAQHRLWLPVPQLDRSDVFVGADRSREWPVRLYRINVPGSR